MLKDVTLGRYYPADSILHSLDPRTKMAALLAYIVGVFLCGTWFSCLIPFVALVLLVALSEVPVKYMLRGLKAIAVIVAATDLVNILFVDNGLWKAFVLTLRIIELVLCSNVLSLTTKPKAIADGLERSFGWMKRIRVPVHDLATAISIAFRFIPILSSEADRIIDAQKSRGADFESGNMVRRAKALLPIMVPLFSSAFRRSDELAMAMDSRLYGSSEPTSFHPLKYSGKDALAFLLVFVFLSVVVAMKVFGL